MEYILPWIFLGWIFCAFGAAAIGSHREAQTEAFIYGMLFGPIGLIVAGFLDQRLQCPMCHGRVNGEPSLCPHCRTGLKWRDVDSFWGEKRVATPLNPPAPDIRPPPLPEKGPES